MRTALTVIFAVALTGTSFAQRPNTMNMTCAQAAATVATYGAVVLSTGVNTYDRFVANGSFCLPGQHAEHANAPTLDTPYCAIGYVCEERRRRFMDDY